MRRVLNFAIIASFSLLALQSQAASICSLSRIQSQNYACEFTYALTKMDSNTGAGLVLAMFRYENDQEKNNIGCDNGGVENANSKRQLQNAQQAAADLKAAGVCDVLIQEF
jgi:hypothetical protein